MPAERFTTQPQVGPPMPEATSVVPGEQDMHHPVVLDIDGVIFSENELYGAELILGALFLSAAHRGVINHEQQVWVFDPAVSYAGLPNLTERLAMEPYAQELDPAWTDRFVRMWSLVNRNKNPATQFDAVVNYGGTWTFRIPEAHTAIEQWRQTDKAVFDDPQRKQKLVLSYANDQRADASLATLAEIIGLHDWTKVGHETRQEYADHPALSTLGHLIVVKNTLANYKSARSMHQLRSAIERSLPTDEQNVILGGLLEAEKKYARNAKYHVSLGLEMQATEPQNIHTSVSENGMLLTKLGKGDYLLLLSTLNMDATGEDLEDDYFEAITSPCFNPDIPVHTLRQLQEVGIFNKLQGLSLDINVSDLTVDQNGGYHTSDTGCQLNTLLSATGLCVDPVDFTEPWTSYWVAGDVIPEQSSVPQGAVEQQNPYHQHADPRRQTPRIVSPATGILAPAKVAEFRTFSMTNIEDLQILLRKFSTCGAAAKAIETAELDRDETQMRLAASWNNGWTQFTELCRKHNFDASPRLWYDTDFIAFGNLILKPDFKQGALEITKQIDIEVARILDLDQADAM